jgi:succinylglutamate desuccinylase
MHGNEPAGVRALELIFKMLEIEPITNPEFTFSGRFLGIIGNLKAFQAGQRYINQDLNRMFTTENVKRVLNSDIESLCEEEKELKEFVQLIKDEISDYQPEKVVLLDLHTTTAFGGIFSIATDDDESIRIATQLNAPVVSGLLEGIKGTSMHYFNTENTGVPTYAVAFESGQHDEHLSVNRAIAAVINCMRTIQSVKAEDVENRHDALLIDFSKGLPKIAELITAHKIKPGDNFVMQSGFKNFQRVEKGDLLAEDKNGPIYAEAGGLILMPLYQTQGEDGFFLIKELNDIKEHLGRVTVGVNR